jgi:hypothetical protein
MTERFNSLPGDGGSNPNKLTVGPGANHLAITDDRGNGRYVDLSNQDTEALVIELLAKRFHAEVSTTGDGWTTLKFTERRPAAPEPKEGEYYRVKGDPGMIEPWCDSPVAKVTKVSGKNYIHLETADGAVTGWSNMRRLEGPLNVSVKTEWIVEG